MVETRYCLDLVVLDKMCQGCKVINFLQHKSWRSLYNGTAIFLHFANEVRLACSAGYRFFGLSNCFQIETIWCVLSCRKKAQSSVKKLVYINTLYWQIFAIINLYSAFKHALLVIYSISGFNNCAFLVVTIIGFCWKSCLFCRPFLSLFAGLDALKQTRKIYDEGPGLYRYDLAEAGPGPKYELSTYFYTNLNEWPENWFACFEPKISLIIFSRELGLDPPDDPWRRRTGLNVFILSSPVKPSLGRMNESWLGHEWVMSHQGMNHVTPMNNSLSYWRMCHVINGNESRSFLGGLEIFKQTEPSIKHLYYFLLWSHQSNIN